MITLRIIASVSSLVLMIPSFSLAQPDLSPLQRLSRSMIEAAQAHYQSGTRFFETAQFDAALVEFEAAWNPTTLCTSSLVHLRVSGGWFTGLSRERNWTLLDLSYGSKKDGIV